MLTDLADYLRTIFDQPASDLHPLRREWDFLEKYVAIEQRRFANDLQVELRYEPELATIPVPVLLMQPLVENAIKYGYNTTRERLQVCVNARREGTQVHLTVENSGQWVEPAARKGLGLENVRKRLKLLYSDTATLQIYHETGRVIVGILLPCKTLHNPG